MYVHTYLHIRLMSVEAFNVVHHRFDDMACVYEYPHRALKLVSVVYWSCELKYCGAYAIVRRTTSSDFKSAS